MRYSPEAWFWVVGDDTTRVYSSRARAYLPADHPNYRDWVRDGGVVTPIDTEENLRGVFEMAGCPDRWHETPITVPLPMVRKRLTDAGLWDEASAALMARPALMISILTAPAVDVEDTGLRDLLGAIGADVETILAPA